MLSRIEKEKLCELFINIDGSFVPFEEVVEELISFVGLEDLDKEKETCMSNEILNVVNEYIENILDEISEVNNNDEVALDKLIELTNIMLLERDVKQIIEKYEGD